MGLFGKTKPAKDTKDVAGANYAPAKSKPPKMKKSCQEVIDYTACTPEGIFVSGDCYSKLYELTDSNFVTETEDKQLDIMINYTKLMNKFPDNIDISIIIVNERNTKEDMIKAYHLKPQGDNADKFRADYNKIIDKKIEQGHSDIVKNKYIMLTVHAKDLSSAELDFTSADLSLQEATKTINRVGVKQLDAISRLTLMQKILRGSQCVPFQKEYEKFIAVSTDGEGNEHSALNLTAMKKMGVTTKDLIAPQMMKKTTQCIQLDDDRYSKSFSFHNLPQQLDTIFLTKATDMPYEMVTVIQFKPVPRKKALFLVKNQNTAIKADVIKASQSAIRSGYGTDLINEDLINAKNDAGKLRDDIVNEGKKLFFTTMVTTIFGSSDIEIKQIQKQYAAKCADFSVTPSYLMGQQIQGLNTALLCSNSKVIIDRMLTSDQSCALFPFNIQSLTDKRGHFYGSNAISNDMIMYDRKRSKLANGLIFGQSGSGKSFITKGEIIPNLLDGNQDKMIILDPENEYHVVAEAFGGVTIDLELKADYHINPCDLTMEWNDPKATPLATKIDYMVGLVEAILGKGRECNVLEQNVIARACERMYADYIEELTRRHRDGCEAGQSDEFDAMLCPTLKDFFRELKNDGSMEGDKVSMIVEQYAVGAFDLFAHHTNVSLDNRLVVFNLLYLPEKMTEMAMKVCLSAIWTEVVKNREENQKYHTGKSIWVYLDEFHHFFKTEASASTILAYYKRVRKYGGIMTGITQDVSDLLSSRQGTGMFNNTGFFIFLNQSPVGREQIQSLYGVSDTLINYIKDQPSGRGLIYNGYVLVPIDYKLPTDSDLYRIMSTNPNDENAKKKQAKDKANSEMSEIEKEKGIVTQSF